MQHLPAPIPPANCLVIGGPRHGEVVCWGLDRMHVALIDRWPLSAWKEPDVIQDLVGRQFVYRRVRVAALPGTVRWALIPNSVPYEHEMEFVLVSVFDMAAGRPLVMGEG